MTVLILIFDCCKCKTVFLILWDCQKLFHWNCVLNWPKTVEWVKNEVNCISGAINRLVHVHTCEALANFANFLQELTELHHENVVALLDCQDLNHNVYLVMEVSYITLNSFVFVFDMSRLLRQLFLAVVLVLTVWLMFYMNLGEFDITAIVVLFCFWQIKSSIELFCFYFLDILFTYCWSEFVFSLYYVLDLYATKFKFICF